jgi:hypothetical protein
MVKLIVKKIDDKNIEIEDVLKGTSETVGTVYHARSNNKTGTVAIKYKDSVVYFYHYSEIEVDTLGVLTSAADTARALNTFIGNFNPRGGASDTTLLEGKADKIQTPHIDWNPSAFSIPAGRTLKFNTATTPVLSGTELSTIALFSPIGDGRMLGFYSNDSGTTTQAGVFHVNDDETAFVPDVLLYDGASWLNDGELVLTYDISGDINEYIGDDTALAGFDIHEDMTILDVPDMNLIDVLDYAATKQKKLSAGVGIILNDIGDGNEWVEVKLAAPSPEADPEQAAGARETGEALQRIEEIATGAKVGLAFDTTEQLNDWLAGTYERADGKTPADLQVGWDLYILALDEPDYWWDGTGIQALETKTDLSEYYTITETDGRFVQKTDLKMSLFVEKIGINSLIYPKYFRYDKALTVSKVILSGNATGASFLVEGTNYDEATLPGTSVPAGADLIIEDINIAAGHDTGSLTIIF